MIRIFNKSLENLDCYNPLLLRELSGREDPPTNYTSPVD
jgi:hypothetical protein